MEQELATLPKKRRGSKQEDNVGMKVSRQTSRKLESFDSSDDKDCHPRPSSKKLKTQRRSSWKITFQIKRCFIDLQKAILKTERRPASQTTRSSD